MIVHTGPRYPRALGTMLVTLVLAGGVACQPAAPAVPTTAPTTAATKPTIGSSPAAATGSPASSPAASPASSPVASPASSPLASPVASPAGSPVASPAASPAASPGASPAASSGGVRVLSFDAADFAFTTPDTIQAGLVSLVMRNTGREPHHGQLLRLNTGVTLDQFMAALQQGEGPALALVSLEGGTGAVGPNAASEVTLDLKDGLYVMVCFIPSPDGVPHLAKGMVKPIQVTPPAAVAAAQPSARETLAMKDFAFDMPDVLPAGRNTFRIVSAGPTQPHELQFARLQPGKTDRDVIQFWTAPPSGPPPYQTLGGMQGLAPNSVGWATVDLSPGSYAAICVIPEPASGKRHVELGMIKPFTVR